MELDEIKKTLIQRKEALLDQPCTEKNSHTVELIDIYLGIQDGH